MSENGKVYVVVILTAVLTKKVNSKPWIAKHKICNHAYFWEVCPQISASPVLPNSRIMKHLWCTPI